MAAIRLFDCFNGKIGTTQVVGVDELIINHGFRVLSANNDGYVGEAARDKNRFFAETTLRCQDFLGFDDILALFEAADSKTVYAEGKYSGDTAKSYSAQMARGKLAGASLQIMDGGYASSQFNLINSAASASDTVDDEVTLAEIASKSITHAAGKRVYRITSVVHGGAITPLSVKGFTLNLQGQVDRTAGDDDFGETCEISGYQLTGTLIFQDNTVSALRTMGQRLLAAAMDNLVVNVKQSASGSAAALTIANVTFEEDQDSIAGRKFGLNTLKWGGWFNSGTTPFTLATGASKMIAAA